MRKLGRNEPCPCGSGLKVKRCCGVDAIRRRTELAAGAAAELFDLARHFPRCRPASESFDAWARLAPEEASEEAVDAGLDAIGEEERARIVGDHAAQHPQAWASLLADFRNDPLAVEIVLKGAVVAGVVERRSLRERAFAALESHPPPGGVDWLSWVIDPGDLWSVVESGEVAAVLDAELTDEMPDDEHAERWEQIVEREAARRLTPWHEGRLEVLLARLRERLPLDDYPRISRRLLDELDRLDAAGRRVVATKLLADSLDRIWDEAVPLAA
ncbi:MAG: YecA family protein [Gaiellaceae bacterium]